MKKPIAILGFGGEGRAVLKFLKKSKKFRGREIWVLDKSPRLDLPKGVYSRLGSNYLSELADFETVFRSPGVPYNLPELKAARLAGVKLSSATKLFFENVKVPVIGVTGTKGKGTTSTLIYKLLKAGGKKVFLAGNIGVPAVEILPKLKPGSFAILELSSFQLQDLDRSPNVAVVLELFPDHQDSHKNLAEYYGSKANIVRHQKPTDMVFFFANQEKSRKMGLLSRAKKIAVNPDKFIAFDIEELKVRGAHNFRNVCMATMVAESLGVPKKTIIRTVHNFKGLDHRLEFVRKIKNIFFYNDSASTNPHTSAAAIRAFKNMPSVFILGGFDKGLDYAPLRSAIREAKPKLIILLGANSKKIYKTIKKTGVEIKFSKNLKNAVSFAYSALSPYYPLPTTHCAVVLSPGAASFDMFKNYADRGNQFKKNVKKIK